MYSKFIKFININKIRFIKIIKKDNNFILIGSKLYKSKNNIKKYILYKYLLNENFELIDNSEMLINFSNIEPDYLEELYKSLWLRNIYEENNIYYLLVDFNKNIQNEYFESNNYLLKTIDFEKFEIVKKYDDKNILHIEYLNNSFISKIIKDKNNNWGKYLFEFIINDKKIIPLFDNFIDYNNDIGHLIHSIEYNSNNDNYQILLSILNKDNEYNIYESYTNDFINYYNTTKIIFNIDLPTNKWFCYPCVFVYNENKYILVNQDDYGKETQPLLFREDNEILNFIEEKYQINNIKSNNLNFNDLKKYIFLDEIIKKNGSRYNYILENNLNLNNYSSHSSSNIDLYYILKQLNIQKNESILDIGSGKGLALSIFNLFPFKNISGIELSTKDYLICQNNFKILNINNINLENINALEYNYYNNFDYLYFYNPFNEEIFEQIIQKLTKKNIKVIYNNIHENEKKILEKYNFILINEIKGNIRNYYIYIINLNNITENDNISNILMKTNLNDSLHKDLELNNITENDNISNILMKTNLNESYYKDLDLNNITENDILINKLIKINLNKPNEPYYIIDLVKIIKYRFINYKNKLYLGYTNNYNIIKDYINNYHIHEIFFWKKINILNNNNNDNNNDNNNNKLYEGYYINFMYSGNDCYYHMILETLLNIFIFIDKNNHLHNKQITILVNDKYNIIKDLFDCNVLEINDYSLIEHLIVPNIKYNYCYDLNKYNIFKNNNIQWIDIDYIKKLKEYIFYKFNIINNLTEKNIFSVIRNNSFRKILNNNILLDIINEYNIEKYYPEKDSFKEQVLKFYSADTVIMQAGSALANVIFMNENSNLILIYNNSTFINKNILDIIKELNINLIAICTTPIYHQENIFNNNFNNNFTYHPYNADLFLNNFNLDKIINFLNNYFKLNFIKDIFKKNSSDYDNLNYYFIELENNNIESFLNNNSNLIIKNKKIINYNDLYNVNINNNEKIYENEYITYM